MTRLSKVLAGFVIVLSIVVFFVGVMTFRVLEKNGTEYQKRVDTMAQQELDINRLLTEARDLKVQYEMAIARRNAGQIWYGEGYAEVSDDDTPSVVKARIDSTSLPEVRRDADGNPLESVVVYIYETWEQSDPSRTPADDATLQYLGQYNVIQIEPDATALGDDPEDADYYNVTLAPSYPLADEQWQVVSNSADQAGLRWIMYENMPSDNHEILAGMSDPEIQALLAGSPATADEFVRHGKAAGANDDPNNVMVSVRFNKYFSQPMNADGTPNQNIPAEDILSANLQGRLRNVLNGLPPDATDQDAQDRFHLLSQEDLADLIVKDEYARFTREIVNQLVNDFNNLAVESPPPEEQDLIAIYSRPLRNYDYLFREHRRNMIAINDTTRQEEADKSRIERAETGLGEDLTRAEAELAELVAKKDHTEEERDLVAATANNMATRIDEMRNQIATLREQNRQMREQLRQLQLAEAAAINSRTRANTVSSSDDN